MRVRGSRFPKQAGAQTKSECVWERGSACHDKEKT